MSILKIETLTNEVRSFGRNKDEGLVAKRVVRLKDKMFKLTYLSKNGSTKTDCCIQMFTDVNGWVFIANSYDFDFEPASYVSSETVQLKTAKDFYSKADKYLITLFNL